MSKDFHFQGGESANTCSRTCPRYLRGLAVTVVHYNLKIVLRTMLAWKWLPTSFGSSFLVTVHFLSSFLPLPRLLIRLGTWLIFRFQRILTHDSRPLAVSF